MADVMPKIGDIRNLKDLSKVIVLPLLCACYLLQSNFSIEIDGFLFIVNEDASFTVQIIQTISIFTLKTLWAAVISALSYLTVILADIYVHRLILPITVLLLLTLGFIGIFSPPKIALLEDLSDAWFYSCFVIGFFLLAMQDEVERGTGNGINKDS